MFIRLFSSVLFVSLMLITVPMQSMEQRFSNARNLISGWTQSAINAMPTLPSMQGIMNSTITAKDSVIESVKDHPYIAATIGSIMAIGSIAYLYSKFNRKNSVKVEIAKREALLQPKLEVPEVKLEITQANIPAVDSAIVTNNEVQTIDVMNNTNLPLGFWFEVPDRKRTSFSVPGHTLSVYKLII